MNPMLTLREIPNFPPPWSYASTGQAGERRGRIAARRGFVDLKLCFTRAAAELQGTLGNELQRQVRQANEPIELWLLRGSILDALPHERCEPQRLALERSLRQVLPDQRPR